MFEQLLPAFPDLCFNARFLTTTGLDDCAHVEIQVMGTHSGAPFAPLGWPALQPSGRRLVLPVEFLRLRIHDMDVSAAAADPLPQPEHGFPTGLYLAAGGSLPGF